MKFFKPDDFSKGHPGDWTPYTFEQMAKAANEKLNELIESWPVVYSANNSGLYSLIQDKNVTYTHKARLAFIEEICNHEPIEDMNYNYTNSNGWKHSTAKIPLCRYCGVELQATWSEKK